jgi:hypothetical protein
MVVLQLDNAFHLARQEAFSLSRHLFPGPTNQFTHIYIPLY